jgi:hypothetical protein
MPIRAAPIVPISAVPIEFEETLRNGLVPSGALGAELSRITRQAFLPQIYAQIYKQHPIVGALQDMAVEG